MKKSEIQNLPEYFNLYTNLVENIEIIPALEKYGINYLASEIPKFILLGVKTYAPNKWRIKDILQHIIDTERIFTYRALRFARNDLSILEVCDENTDAQNAHANDRTIEELIAEFNATRLSTILLFKSFNKEMLNESGIVSDKKISVLAIGFVIIGHLLHHLKVVDEKYYPLLK